MAKANTAKQRAITQAESPVVRGLVYVFTTLSVVFAVVAYALYW